VEPQKRRDASTGAFRQLGIEGRFLRSRVARRIFLSVVLCALVPISSYAVLSFQQVTAQLEHDAAERLAENAKQRGMAALERLLLADATLRVIEQALVAEPGAPTPGALPPALQPLAAGRLVELAFARSRLPGAGDPPLLDAFEGIGPADEASLASGGALLRIVRHGGSAQIVLAHVAPGPRGERLVAAALEPRFLFAPDGLRSRQRLRVTDPSGAPIFAARSDEDDDGTPRDDETLSASWSLFLRAGFRADPWSFVLEEPTAAALAPLRRFQTIFPLVSLLSLLVMGLSALVLVRRSLVPIEILHGATRRIAARDFAARVSIRSGDEFQDLGHSFNQMAESIGRHVSVMATLNEVGSALSVERDRARLLDAIVRGAMAVTGARAGTLCLLDASDRPAPMLLHVLDAAEEATLAARFEAAARRAAASERPVEEPGDGALSIPMRNHEGEVIGVLQLAPASGSHGFEPEARRVAESLASQTAVALTRDRLAGEFRALFEGLIQLLVRAIDEKSPYTGAHCRRVPILTEMIADAACATDEGPLRHFSLSETERYELRIAALLHDCGKVTTPVHVQDKATKLETLYDRIGLVDVRFEVVRRELELEHARAGGGRDELDATLRRLDADRAFLHRANQGGESMDEADQERVREIATRWRWRGPDGAIQPILGDEEVENLCVARGTLNAREREIINQHVVATIQMLEELPYPRSLRNVPFIAGAHHERMDGHGYPKRLVRDQMSIQARILGLADVFEALTAKDRPYKPGMRVSTALEILGRMKDEGHVDPDLFEVFVREKVYLRYAAQWLDPEQIDDDFVDAAAAAMVAAGEREPRG
jgi:HD-GYP domain-containing protein (c-di-GMP phosphodiesterase class II)/HAMP domain-containing protein